MENEKEKLSSSENSYLRNWTINMKKCTTCCDCIDACPRGLLYFYEEKKLILIKDEAARCTYCGDCASACAFYAIVLT